MSFSRGRILCFMLISATQCPTESTKRSAETISKSGDSFFFPKSESGAEIRERQNSPGSMQFSSLSGSSPFTGGCTAAVMSAGESQSLAAPYTAGS